MNPRKILSYFSSDSVPEKSCTTHFTSLNQHRKESGRFIVDFRNSKEEVYQRDAMKPPSTKVYESVRKFRLFSVHNYSVTLQHTNELIATNFYTLLEGFSNNRVKRITFTSRSTTGLRLRKQRLHRVYSRNSLTGLAYHRYEQSADFSLLKIV